jgi:glycosyltransferase involved in cell wall biosynthesis
MVVGYTKTAAALPGMTRAKLKEYFRQRGTKVRAEGPVDAFRYHGVEVRLVHRLDYLLTYFEAAAQQSGAETIVVSLEDPSLQMLAAANAACPATVAFIQTTYSLPFGPDLGFPGVAESEQPLKDAAAIITLSRFTSSYVKKHGGLSSTLFYVPAYGKPPFPVLGRYQNPYVTLINPYAQKGLPIFEGLARAMPQVAFAAVPTWGATRDELPSLKSLANVTLLKPSVEIDDILRQTRVLLVPSLYHEAFGHVVNEALSRGVPVLASNTGGLPEAVHSKRQIVPVRPINRYSGKYDAKNRTIPIVPKQNIKPWKDALAQLLSDEKTYLREARRCRKESLAFIKGLGVRPFEAVLRKAIAKSR